MNAPRKASPLKVSGWLNTDSPITLEDLSGQVVLIEAFQMLCPGCVAHGLPQAKRVAETFGDRVRVLGLHTVFEHHAAQGPKKALEAFLHEYRIGFPVGIDQPHPEGGPAVTMRQYGMQGTPTLVLIDRAGNLRRQTFGRLSDMQLGADIRFLIDEPISAEGPAHINQITGQTECNDDGCTVS